MLLTAVPPLASKMELEQSRQCYLIVYYAVLFRLFFSRCMALQQAYILARPLFALFVVFHSAFCAPHLHAVSLCSQHFVRTILGRLSAFVRSRSSPAFNSCPLFVMAALLKF